MSQIPNRNWPIQQIDQMYDLKLAKLTYQTTGGVNCEGKVSYKHNFDTRVVLL